MEAFLPATVSPAVPPLTAAVSSAAVPPATMLLAAAPFTYIKNGYSTIWNWGTPMLHGVLA